jgi:hypothetical protein
MIDLRRLARDYPCEVRLDQCKSQPTCLAHLRQTGISGMGMKAPDVLGCPACDSCHERVDRTERGNPDTQLAFYRGIARWINRLVKDNILRW